MQSTLALHVDLALREIEATMAEAYLTAGLIGADHPLASSGLRDGAAIARGYLDHDESVIAFEHILYMISEADLVVSNACREALAAIAQALRRHCA